MLTDRDDRAVEEDLESQEEPAGEASEELEAEPDDGREWFVVHTYSGYENKVKVNLERRVESMNMADKIFEVVIPSEEQLEIKNGKRVITQRKIFPGYVLVQMIMDDDSWYVVRNTPGITGFVGMGTKPTPLLPEEVDSIIRQTGAEAPTPKIKFSEGESVKITSGPFGGFIGVVDEINLERGKIRVLVSMFGRETPVELEFSQLEKL